MSQMSSHLALYMSMRTDLVNIPVREVVEHIAEHVE